MKVNTLFIALRAAHALAASGPQPPPSVATSRQPSKTILPALSEILAVQATARPASPTSDVKGVAFDRIVQIWLENIDFEVSRRPSF